MRMKNGCGTYLQIQNHGDEQDDERSTSNATGGDFSRIVPESRVHELTQAEEHEVLENTTKAGMDIAPRCPRREHQAPESFTINGFPWARSDDEPTTRTALMYKDAK